MPNGGQFSAKTKQRKQHSSPSMQRRLERGAKKLARRASRISLHHQSVGGPSASEVVVASDAHPNNTQPKEHQA